MTGYRIFKTETLPDSLRNKPKWMICIILTAGLLVMTLSAIGAGGIIGYTYCYVAHGTGFKPVTTLPRDIQIFNISFAESKEDAYKKSINGAILLQMQKILQIGHTLWDRESFNVTN